MYDLGIIGGGPAGYVAAEKAGHAGLKVVLFEGKELGGVCLNEGCIPTKSLLYSAKLYEHALHGASFGINASGVEYDYGTIFKRKNKIVKKLVRGVGSKMKVNHVEVISEFAVIRERSEGFIQLQAGNTDYQCKNILICTGSESVIPPIPGLEKDNILTSREILNLEKIPESLVVIGGGVIGCEFANFFSTMGCKVTVIEMMDEILPGMDREQSVLLRKEMELTGVDFNLGCRVTSLKGKKVFFEKDGKEQSVEAAEVLISVGRKPVTSGAGLENIGVELFRGGIKIDEHCRTNIPNVYAAGDVTGFSLLAHTASREGEVAVNNIAGKKDVMRYRAIPAVVYTNPEVAGVGLTEEMAGQKNIEYEVRSLPMTYAGRFMIENESFSGMCKILVGKKYGEVLGVHMIGNPASEMIFGAAMAIESEMTLDEMKELIFPHPTISEIIKENVFTF